MQSRVAFLNNLSHRGSPTRGESPTRAQASSGSQNAALQRAVLGREEAESALSQVSVQLSETQSRERRICERVECLMEDLQTAKERQSHERVVFEKEIRKVRKEAFRAGSALVKLQEELKHSRAESKGLKDEVLSERQARENAKQEAFERTYALASLTEELEVLKGRLRSVEANNHSDTLEAQAQRIHKVDIGRLSLAEGDLAFLTTPRKHKRSAEDSVNSPIPEAATPSYQTPPKRQRVSDVTTEEENRDIITPQGQRGTITELQDDLEYERQRAAELEEMIHFMQMECQFKACSCRLAESRGEAFVHDKEYAHRMSRTKEDEAAKRSEMVKEQPGPATDTAGKPSLDMHASTSQAAVDGEIGTKEEANEPVGEPLITFSPATGTFRTIPSPARAAVEEPQGEPMVISRSVESGSHPHSASVSSERFSKRRTPPSSTAPKKYATVRSADPARPTSHLKSSTLMPQHQEPNIDTNTKGYQTTKTIPLRSESPPSHDTPVEGTPINRETALAQIRARRGRANSTKRSASASEATVQAARAGVTPVRDSKRIPGLHQQNAPRSEGDASERRDLSAPVRMFRR